MKLTDEQRAIVRCIQSSKDADFSSLVRMAKLDPGQDFRYANLSEADFGRANLEGFDFTGANLNGANLRQSSISGAIFLDADTLATKWPVEDHQKSNQDAVVDQPAELDSRRYGEENHDDRRVVNQPRKKDRNVSNVVSSEEFRSNAPLMPKATAVWLVENTSLTFDQIAVFCKLHPLEIKAIADGDTAQGIKGLDPILTGQLTREEIATGEADPNHRLRIADPRVRLPEARGPRYTPVSRRQDRPNAILWLVRHHPELKDSQIMRLVGTTKSTILAIRDRTHWNSTNLTPLDPVTLGLCSQIELDFEVRRAVESNPASPEQSSSLLPGKEARALPETEEQSEALDVAAVFAKLKRLSKGDPV
jgi:hypothetical protein